MHHALPSQLSKDSERMGRQAKLADLRGTSGLADASDVVLTGFRPNKEDDLVTWDLAKNRHGEVRSFDARLDGHAQKFRF